MRQELHKPGPHNLLAGFGRELGKIALEVNGKTTLLLGALAVVNHFFYTRLAGLRVFHTNTEASGVPGLGVLLTASFVYYNSAP